MLQKFPQKTIKKWTRFNIFEQWYIIYSLILSLLIAFLPIFQVGWIMSWYETQSFWLTNNWYFMNTGIIIITFLIIMILRNISFRFRKMIQFFVWFKDNEALVNFGILLLICIAFVGIWDTINLFWERVSTGIKLLYGYYIISWFLILWLIGNLLLAVNFSKNKKRSQLVNIIQKEPEEEEVNQIKWLFE